MNKHKSALILSMAVILALFIYGCCSHSRDAFFANPAGDTVVTSREVIIDELGRLPTVTFPSGAKIEGLEENTLTPGIVVSLIEQKTTSQNSGYFSNSNPYIYMYRITAFQSPSNLADSKTYVTTTEKPLRITLPKPQNSQGIILAGIKESDTAPWRLFNFSDSDNILANVADVRAIEANTTDNTFNLFRLGTQFALVSYEGNTGNRLPEIYVTSLVASSTPSLLVKDGKYLEDLTIKGILKGVKLDSIKPTDLRARITYRNNVADEAPIKVNGANITQTNKSDKTVPGYTYCHSFLVDSVTESNLMGNSGEFAFTLNLDAVETQSFSSGFLIEFFNKVDSEKILPYNYTEFYTINKKDVVTLTITANGGNPDGLYELDPTFVINIGVELSDSDKQKIESAISVTNIEPDKITKEWNEEGLTIGFVDELEPDTTYTLTVDDVTDVEGISIKDVEDFTFKTKSVNNAFTITYNLDGGQTATDNPTSYDITSDTITLNNPNKDYYTFVGWVGSNGDVPQTTVTILSGSIGDKTFTASYTPISYNIAYILNDGILATDNPTSYDITSATITLANPTKDGYTFIGWSGTGLTGNNNLSVTIEQGSTGDRAYTANWSAVAYNITYELNGGILAESNPEGYNTASETFILNEPTKEGYTFLGWTGSNGDVPQKPLAVVQGSTSDLSFVANWSINSYNLTINKGTGINTVSGDGLHEYNSVVNATCTMLAGYEFDSWSGDFNTESFNMPADNATMTANARPISYSIICNLDGGTADNPTSYDVTSATINLTNPTKNGYTFTGWSGTGLTGDDNMTVSIPNGSHEAKEYTAHWSLVSYTITCNIGDGTLGTANPATYDVTSSTITLNNPTANQMGYEFIGWTGSNGDTPQTTVTIPQGSTENKTYTANYTLVSYSITCNLDGGTANNPISYDVTSATINITNPTKNGYTFTGWSGTGLTGDDNMAVSIPNGSHEAKEYTAHWSLVSYTITCNIGDGTLGTANPATYDVTSATITLNNPTANQMGYEFIGWTGSNGDTPQTTVTIPSGSYGNKTFTANYELAVYTITYDLADGTLPEGITNPSTYDITSATITLNNPTKDGIYFMGWTSDDFFGASMSVTIPQGSTGNKTYTANWGEILTFNLPNGVSLVMHKIPAGTFIMGSPTDEVGHSSNETQHQVTLTKAFYIGRFEVTQDQYFAVMGTNPSNFKEGAAANVRPTTSANYPVERVNCTTARTFCASLTTYLTGHMPTGFSSFDLPTEAQWEYACRAGTITSLNNNKNLINAFEFDSNLDEVAWYKQNWGQSNSKTHTVGEKLPNAWGLYDMHGNVWEWCLDWFGNYPTTAVENPVGPDGGSYRVWRGGSWNYNPNNCRSAFRIYNTPSSNNNYLGFRLVLVPAP